MFSSAGARIRVVVAFVLTALLALTLSSCSSDSDSTGAAPQDLCAPPGVGAATAAPTNLDAGGGAAAEDRYTTADVTPLDQIDTSTLNLITPGVITVGTLSDAPPSICINSDNEFTGYDNELLKAVAEKLGLRVDFVGTEFAGLLAQV
ncbi:MAG: transporter substrate-binding domain-containing protein, partial [Rhodococcus sp. (in: high G+C Gram-positive bacteria)]|uniref:transporter substrate-binding domain-containing protein n=1 Tax=Rhodococcus sp. TaxID=1831 RepID=UPI003BB19A61